jgi:hypothetical protein
VKYPGTALPQGADHYSTFSTYYGDGQGFWVVKGDAASPNPATGYAWKPLRFEYPQDHDSDIKDYSSFLTNAAAHPTLYVQRDDQQWPRLLLPNIYHAPPHCRIGSDRSQWGGLKGELPIFLGLIAHSTSREWLPSVLPRTFIGGAWIAHQWGLPWTPRRGVVVSVYTCPPTTSNPTGSTEQDLEDYEEGLYGNYFN